MLFSRGRGSTHLQSRGQGCEKQGPLAATAAPGCPRRGRSSSSLPVAPQAAPKDKGSKGEAPESDDMVTRWVGRIFGRAAVDDPTPFGLRRMDWDSIKDLEVTMGRDAAPVATDDPTMKLFRPLLAGTQLETEDLRCCYSANEDGWTPGAFHAGVDGYGATLVLARTQGGALIGGYNPLGYDGYGSDKSTMGSFLFTWPDGNTKAGSRPFKLPKISTDQLAVIDKMDQGPQFGPGDLKILLQRGNPKKVTSKLIDYQRPPSGVKSLFNTAKEPGTTSELVELRAYVL